MEDRDRSRSPSRKTSRVEQVVGRWLRRSRESTSRERVLDDDGKAADESPQELRSCAIRVTVQIELDPGLKGHGFSVSTHTPVQVHEVTAGGPADGRLLPGDQLIKINNIAVDDLPPEQTADIVKECKDTITMTVLRITVGPKSSFITPEKRAKLKSNPVKVRFAEEVVVNGHLQGNSLLFLPNVLKVYLENGQTKAFKFEPKTTVKDIVMTLKEKLSISRIEHFALVLEKQHSISKLFLLHEDELIQEVVQKKESPDYRCLFRVCFMPKHLEDILEEDPIAFEYLYLQSVNDVLQERFAVEMKCNTAIKLAALHIQERLASTGQSPKTPLKTITKDWGIECFISNTLLRNMREKDLRKAISYHMKKILLQEHKHKMTVKQARLNYLKEMAELKSFGGKSFSATMMLQDRESTVSLLVGAQYGVSQVINHKMSIMTTLTEFSSITRVELVLESERVSVVKIYLQDIKPITLLLECAAAKDLACVIAGYCRLFVDPQICVFPWTVESKSHRISAEEGYVSRCCSDSEDSDVDLSLLAHMTGASQGDSDVVLGDGQVAEQEDEIKSEKEAEDVEDKSEKDLCDVETPEMQSEPGHVEMVEEMVKTDGENSRGQEDTDSEPQFLLVVDDPPSETSDSYQTDSRFLTSMSSDSMDALEEDDFLTYFSTGYSRDCSVHANNLLPLPRPVDPHCQDSDCSDDLCFPGDQFLSLAALSSIADCLPSPPEASDDDDEDYYDEHLSGADGQKLGTSEGALPGVQPSREGCVFTFEQGDTRQYYNICSNVTPDSAHLLASTLESQGDKKHRGSETVPILLPPPGFGDSSSDEEFFDAQERFAITEEHLTTDTTAGNASESSVRKRAHSLSSIRVGVCEGERREENEELQPETKTEILRCRKRYRKRRSYMETDYTSLVSFPGEGGNRTRKHHSSSENFVFRFDGGSSDQTSCPTVLSLTNAEGEPAQLETKPITPSTATEPGRHASHGISKVSQRKQQLMLMEPDSMEFKSVTELMSAVSPAIVAIRTPIEPKINDNASYGNYAAEEEGAVGGVDDRLLSGHLFFSTSIKEDNDDQQFLFDDLPLSDQTPASDGLPLPDVSYTQSLERDDKSLETRTEICTTEPTPRRRSHSMSSVSDRQDSVCSTSDFPGQWDPLVHTKEPLSDGTDSSSEPSIQELPSVFPSAEIAQGCLFAQCSSGILGRLSASTLRGKIQNLPLYLSRSQEVLASNSCGISNAKPVRTISETQSRANEVELAKEATEDMTTTQHSELKLVALESEEVTEVFEEMTEVIHDKPREEGPELKAKSPSVVVTTQNLNGLWGVVTSQEMTGLRGQCSPLVDDRSLSQTPDCGSSNCKFKPTLIQPGPHPHGKPQLGCGSALAAVCETVMEGAQTPMEVCGCQTSYANCFSSVLDSSNFDDELTVYEFSCRTQQRGCDRRPLMTSIPPSSLSGSSSSFSPSSPLPSVPRVVLPPSTATELGPLLSPLDAPECFLSDPHVDAVNTLLLRCYPLPPAGFMAVQRDIDTLLTILAGAVNDQRGGQEHPREACVDHFSENKRRLHVEARGLMAGCQQVVQTGQTPAETLQALAKSFHSLVQLTAVCLSFSSCPRCEERHAESLLGLSDVAQTYQEFARAAERLGMATERRTCHELSIKLLARQCTALTTSVFCLTQLFRTLTSL